MSTRTTAENRVTDPKTHINLIVLAPLAIVLPGRPIRRRLRAWPGEHVLREVRRPGLASEHDEKRRG
eukprot:8515353-Pyramimonas_sp.AAC.1